MLNKRKHINILILMMLIIIILTPVNIFCNEDEYEDPEQYHGRILEILDIVEEEGESYQLLLMKVLEGDMKGKSIKAYNYFNEFFPQYNIDLKPGSQVLFFYDINETEGFQKAIITTVAREKYLLWPFALFIVLLLCIGRFQGLKTIISLAITILSIIYILLPLILKGYDPAIVSVIICVFNVLVTLFIVGGFNRKTVSAILGTSFGIIFAGVLVLIIAPVSYITGFGETESQYLSFIPQQIDFNFSKLLFASIIIGATGAIMDIGMSISSSVNEIYVQNSYLTKKELFKSGMNVGRDIMGTMANTLILAYTGASLQLILVLFAYKFSFTDILSNNMIASEVLRALAGSIGIIIAIPATAFISTRLLKEED
jgi:uncharacterized membrane protein